MTITGLRIVAVVLSALGGGVGMMATHRQIEDGNRRRLEADDRARREIMDRYAYIEETKQIESKEEEAS